MTSLRLLILLIVAAGVFHVATEPVQAGADTVTDQPLDEYRIQLLDLAFESASKFPLDPFIKDRSREQEKVVAACFELDQPQRALRYSQQIKNWRRGACLADYAFYCAQHGQTKGLETYLNEAEALSMSASLQWRRDRVRANIARTHLLLGREFEAKQMLAGLEDSEIGKIEAVRASLSSADNFDQRIATLDSLVATKKFDVMKNALESATKLYDRFYDDAARRQTVRRKLVDNSVTMPVMFRVDLVSELVKIALAHDDPDTATQVLDEVMLLFKGSNWPAEYYVPLAARLATLRGRCGDREQAREQLADALKIYEQYENRFLDIDRSDALRPIAEAYHAIGDRSDALVIYKKAVEKGVENPNARPRAVDLSATCVSMAVNGFEPDAALWARLRQIHQGLKQPW